MTKAELEKRLGEQAARIAELEEKVEDLENEVNATEWDRDAREAELGARFGALCRDLDARFPIHKLPIGLQLDLESLAEQLGVPRPWNML